MENEKNNKMEEMINDFSVYFDNIEKKINETAVEKSKNNEASLLSELQQEVKELSEVRKKMIEIVNMKSYIVIDHYLKKNPQIFDNTIYKDFKKLINSNTFYSLDEILPKLKVEKQIYIDLLKKDFIELINYQKERAVNEVSAIFRGLKDLQSPDKIGEIGQRLPNIFEKVRSKYREEELPPDITKLLNQETDITRLIFGTLEIANIFKSLHDSLIYILNSQSENIIKLRNESESLKNENEKLKKSISDLETVKKQIAVKSEAKTEEVKDEDESELDDFELQFK